MDDFPVQKKSVETPAGGIFYFTHMSFPGRPTVVLLHGLSSNHTTWEGVMKKLAEEKINTIALDLRGHGYSDKRRQRSLYALPIMSEDVRAVMRQENIETIHVVGYSWGGYIGMDFAQRFPDQIKSLILVSTGYTNPFAYTIVPFMGLVGNMLLNVLGYLLIWQKRKEYHYFKPNEARGYWDSTFTGLATMPLSINFWMLAEVLKINFRNALPRIAAPTLILYGEHDAFISRKEIRDMAEKIQNSTVVYMENSSHYLATAYQEKITGHIVKFLDSIL